MSREEVQKLLGGYATGTLTPEEQQALFEAALDDQELFDALANEQPLHDLLRDPAAKAEVLAALDVPPARGGWLAWMRLPWVPALAMAGLAVVGVAIWQSNRPREIAAPQLTAQLREPAPQVPQQPPAPAGEKRIGPVAEVDKQTAAKPRSVLLGRLEKSRREVAADAVSAPPSSRDGKDAAAPSATPAPSAPPPPPVVAESSKPSKAKEVEVQAGAQAIQIAPNPQFAVNTQNTQNAQTPSPTNQSQLSQNVDVEQLQQLNDARSQFYARNSFAQQELRQRADKKAALTAAAPAALGVRCSIIRNGNQEVDLSTPLSAGEKIKLRIRPNADGFLYVREGGKVVTSAAVKNNEQFETAELESNAAGRRDLEVVFSRVAISGGAAGLGGARPANLVEHTAGADRGTYIVTGTGSPQQQIVVPISLKWQ